MGDRDPMPRAWLSTALVISLHGALSCQDDEPPAQVQPPPSARAPSVSAQAAPHALASNAADPEPEAPEGRPQAPPCPVGMRFIEGGEFRMGRAEGKGASDERPQFTTRVADYCMDETEVTVAAYQRCREAGKCSEPPGKNVTCNARHDDRGDHPINCVNWHQAHAFCKWREARLPSEVEWEYAARGGSEYRQFSWGDEDPDGRTCWKHAHSCTVKSYEPGAFGLHDMSGNLWEWTDDFFGSFPWPPVDSPTKSYRGGSWSRRFPKWMSTTLRNRFDPDKWGSHLGFRCAADTASTSCAYGKREGGGCLHGVDTLDCPKDRPFNGLRCAAPGAPRCAEGYEVVPGHGCQLGEGAAKRGGDLTARDPTSDVKRSRAPKFDADCQAFQPNRPHAYRFTGGTHVARNRVGKSMGCKNRDVGVGWNSACCP